MILLPYRLDSEIRVTPVITILVCIVCALVYWNQVLKDAEHQRQVETFCNETLDRGAIYFLKNIVHKESGNHCALVFRVIQVAPDTQLRISELAAQAKPIGIFETPEEDLRYINSRLSELYSQYEYNVSVPLTDKLVYDPDDMNLWNMLTSSLAHADFMHLFGNTLFFFVFAASVEAVVGSLVFLGFVFAASISTSLAYSLAVSGADQALPTLGLSGVVMAAVAALGVMLPSANIRCFFWFLVIFKVFRLPAMFLAIWFIGWDIYSINAYGDSSGIDYVSHLSGAATGLLLGLFYVTFRKGRLDEVARTV